MSLRVEAYRPNPVKAFFKNPTLHRVLKVTAVALATLALLAGVVALALFVSPPLFSLVAPVAIIGVALAIIFGKKPKTPAQRSQPASRAADPEMEVLRQRAQNQLEESRRRVAESQNRTVEFARSSYRDYINPIRDRLDIMIDGLKNQPERVAPVLTNLDAHVSTMDQFIQLQRTMGVTLILSEMQEHNEYVRKLRTISREIDAAITRGVDAGTAESLRTTKAAISRFINKYGQDVALSSSSEEAIQPRQNTRQEDARRAYVEMLVPLTQKCAEFAEKIQNPAILDIRLMTQITLDSVEIRSHLRRQILSLAPLEEIPEHRNFIDQLNSLCEKIDEAVVLVISDTSRNMLMSLRNRLKGIVENPLN